MNAKELASLIDHTQLKPYATIADIEKLCEEAKSYRFHAVCVASCFLEYVVQKLIGSEIKTCCVIDFPLGNSTTATRKYAAMLAGAFADELDVVAQIWAIKEKKYALARKDIEELTKCARIIKPTIVKVIIETCYLTKDEIIEACKIVDDAGADYIKTSTGFAEEGAKIEDVVLMKTTLDKMNSKLKIKAAGGINNLEKALSMIKAGADRLGCSKSVQIIEEMLKA